jgi:hypothetical protein
MPKCKQCGKTVGIWNVNFRGNNLCPDCRQKLAAGQKPKDETPFAKERHNAKAGIGVGILLVLISHFLMVLAPPLGLLVRLAGGGAFLWGCYNYMIVKGWQGWFGVFLSLCVGITVLQIVFAMLGNGPQITTVVSGGEGIIYDQLIPYSGILASVWMLSVSATIWFVFRHRNRAAGVLLSCLSPFAYVFLVSIIWSGWIHPSLFWKLQLMTGTLDSIGNISKYQIVTDPTAVVVAFIIAGIAIGAYKITPTKKSLSDENAA